MDEQLARLLQNTQSPDEELRSQAELSLLQLKADPNFPVSLAQIGVHVAAPTELRQSALVYLRKFIEDNWAEGDHDQDQDRDGPYFPMSDAVKNQLRPMMLEQVLGPEGDRKVKLSASYVVTKMAAHDFPDRWPDLLPSILSVMPAGSDPQLLGALVVLQDLVEDAFAGEHFFSQARAIISACFDVALHEKRKCSLRALAIVVFRACFDVLDMVKEDYKTEVKAFAEELLTSWLPFFERVIKSPLPEREAETHTQPDSWHGPISLKIQVLKTLSKIRSVFPALLLPQSPAFFTATWDDLCALVPSYELMFTEWGAQMRLEDADGLPFSLDFLVIDEVDFLNQCLRAAPVQKELGAQLLHATAGAGGGDAHTTSWLWHLLGLLVSFAQPTKEEEELWDIDVSLYLAEEASVSINYTARTACSDLLIKVAEWLGPRALERLLATTKTQFADAHGSWRKQEAALYLFNALLKDLQERDEAMAPGMAAAYLELVHYAVSRQEEPILRARGFMVAANLSVSFSPANALLDSAIQAMTQDASELVQVACIKAMDSFIRSGLAPERQGAIMLAVQQFLEAKDLTELEDADDLLVTLIETLKSAICMDVRITLLPENKAIDLLFLLVKHGKTNVEVESMVLETLEEIARPLTDTASYTALCTKVLPMIVGALDMANVTDDDPLVTMATEMLMALVQHGSEPLPAGFVASTLPRLNRLLMSTTDGSVLRPGAEAVLYMLMHDHHQVFGWHDDKGRSGLETCLLIIDRLLGSEVEENAASEVGGLAAELVEKAGPDRLGPFLPKLLEAVASRLATAEAASFIQSLILVFARLALVGAHDVVNFLHDIQVHGQSGLQVVMSKWLENSINFAGYDEIRQNVIALSKLYSLNDQRLAQCQVKGDLIIKANDSGRIMTRSRARQDPDQYTIIPATLKILKVLIEELLSASGTQAASQAAATAALTAVDANADAGDQADGEGWEDAPDDFVDLSLGRSKAGLMGLFSDEAKARMRDDETQAYLTDFFLGAARNNTADFSYWYGLLGPEEQAKLNELAGQSVQ